MAHIQCSFYSQSLMKNANVIVFIPTENADDYLIGTDVHYGSKGGKYQTLYLLHGSYGGSTDWSLLANVERYAQSRALAVVMPSGENSNYVDMDKGEAYLTYVTEELPAFLSKIFPLSKKREDTFIAGLSMGGYGAFRCALAKPELYGFAASLSGALDMQELQKSTEAHALKMPSGYREAVFADRKHLEGTDNDLSALLAKRVSEKADLPQLYMTCGAEDFIYPTNEIFYDNACKLGVPVTFERAHGVHDWDFWDTHIREVINNLLPCCGDLKI